MRSNLVFEKNSIHISLSLSYSLCTVRKNQHWTFIHCRKPERRKVVFPRVFYPIPPSDGTRRKSSALMSFALAVMRKMDRLPIPNTFPVTTHRVSRACGRCRRQKLKVHPPCIRGKKRCRYFTIVVEKRADITSCDDTRPCLMCVRSGTQCQLIRLNGPILSALKTRAIVEMLIPNQ